MGEKHHTRRTAGFPSFVVVVSNPALSNLSIHSGVRLEQSYRKGSYFAVCSGICIVRHRNDETRAITPAKPKPSTIMYVICLTIALVSKILIIFIFIYRDSLTRAMASTVLHT